MSDPNTRKEKRTPVTLKIKFKSATLDQFIERYSVDVSHGGIFIRTKDPLAVGTQLRFEFQLQDASPLISGEGTVVWTREHDPARVGVAPGMGVRFDKLAPESQLVLDKILQMKAKDTGVDPRFESLQSNDPKTRVAPAPLVSGLAAQSAQATKIAPAPTGPRSTVMGLGPSMAVPPSGNAPAVAVGKGGASQTGKPNTVPAKNAAALAPSRGGFPDEPSRDATPLPKPMPFSSVDDDFSEEAFNQPTRVAGSFEDLLRKAEQEAAANERKAPAVESPPLAAAAPVVSVLPSTTGTNGHARGTGETGSQTDADAAAKKAAEVRAAEIKAAEIKADEKLELEAATRQQEDKAAAEKKAAEKKAADERAAKVAEERAAEAARPAGRRRTSAEQDRVLPSVDYGERKKRSPLPIIIGVLLVGGAAGAYVLAKSKGDETAGAPIEPTPGVAPDPGAGGVTPPVPSDQPEPAVVAVADAAPAVQPPPVGVTVQVVSTPPGATVVVDGKSMGTTPLSLPGLDEAKSYDVTLELACHEPAKLKLDTAKEKAADAKLEATLKPMPRVIRIDTDPKGGAIWIDGANTGKTSPADVPLTGKLDPKVAHKVLIKKSGFQPGETEIGPDAACSAEKGKGVLVAQLTLSAIVKAPPVVAEKKPPREPTPKAPPKEKPPKEPKEPPPAAGSDEPTGLMPKGAPKEPVDPPKEPPKDPPKPPPAGGEEHTPDWMKEG